MTERALRCTISVLLLVATAIVLAGCGSEPEPAPIATPDIPATVSAAVAMALGTPVAQPPDAPLMVRRTAARANGTPDPARITVRPGYCGRLCGGQDYWEDVSLRDVQAELDQGADVSVADASGLTPIHWAVVYRNADVLSLLLESGADANARSEDYVEGTPLWWALQIEQQDPEIVALLLKHGADVNAVGSAGDPNKWTPLYYALSSKNTRSYDIIKILLDHGANVKAKDDLGTTLLHYASQSGDSNVIELLLDRGADIRAKTPDGDTPMHFAALSGKPANVKILLDRGANVNARGNQRQTPCDTAVERYAICRMYYRNPDSGSMASIICGTDNVRRAERAQKEVISLLCR